MSQGVWYERNSKECLLYLLGDQNCGDFRVVRLNPDCRMVSLHHPAVGVENRWILQYEFGVPVWI